MPLPHDNEGDKRVKNLVETSMNHQSVDIQYGLFLLVTFAFLTCISQPGSTVATRQTPLDNKLGFPSPQK